MRLTKINSNAHVLDTTTRLSGNRRHLFSYETPVGYYWAGRVWLLTKDGINAWMTDRGLHTQESYRTTRKHQNAWLESLKKCGLLVNDEFVHWTDHPQQLQ